MTALVDRFSIQVWVYGIDPMTTTANQFILGHTTRGTVTTAGTNKLREVLPVSDITAYVTSVSIRRGRNRAIDSFDAGSATIVLDSSDRRFQPNWDLDLTASGPYSMPWGPVPGTYHQLFRRGRAIRVVAVGTSDGGGTVKRSLWSGWIDDIQNDPYPTGSTSTPWRTTVQCVDAFALAGAVDRNEADLEYGAGETMGPRVRRWAEAAGLILSADTLTSRPFVIGGFPASPPDPSTTWRYSVIGDDGTNTLQGTHLSENCLTAMKAAVASEDGWLYVDPDGRIVYKQRIGRSGGLTWSDTYASSSPNIMLMDNGQNVTTTGNQYLEFEGMPRFESETADLINYCSLARSGGTMRIKVDVDSIDTVGRHSYARTDLINDNDTAVDSIAAAIISRHGGERKLALSGVTCNPAIHDTALYAALFVDLTDAMQFGSTVTHIGTRTMFVNGIAHEIAPGKRWTATYQLSEAD